jgi:hypothetical protein
MRFSYSTLARVGVFGFCFLIAFGSDAEIDAAQTATHTTARLSPGEIFETAQRVVGSDVAVCDVVSLPIRGSKMSDILASVDMSGRRFCNELVRIRLGKRPSTVQSIAAWMVDHPVSILRDLDRDGFPELLVPADFSPYEGAQACVAAVPVVYACSSNTCVDASSRFRSFYEREGRNQERALLRDLATSEVMGADYDRRGLACKIMEIDKLRRMAGIDDQAGLDIAMKWKNSADPLLRRKAVAIFSDIDDDAARKELRDLANDSDPLVANYAEICLARRAAR